MGTILIAWELGAGLGHLVQLAPLVRGLAARGHTVFAALRHLGRASAVFGNDGVSLLAAPWSQTPIDCQVLPPVTVAQILNNMGWHDAEHLRSLCGAWRSLYALVRPEVVVFDHAPTALLASRSLALKRVVIGSGFCVPRDEPAGIAGGRNIRPWVDAPHAAPDAAAAFEREMLARVNDVAREWGAGPLGRVTQLYREADETLLVTLPELDHFGVRPGATYWGPVSSFKDEEGGMKDEGAGDAASVSSFSLHPSALGPRRVFAYLKNFPALPDLLAALEAGGHETVVVCDGVPATVRERFAGSRHLRFEDTPLDLRRAAGRFDLAVLNAGHGATAAMLLAGVPALLVPIHLEQGLLARAAVRNTGACVEASSKDGTELVRRLNAMLEPETFERHRKAARRFAQKYAGLDPAGQVRRMVQRVEALMAPPPGKRPGRAPAGVFAG